MSKIAIDTETTGIDAYHGAKPFYINTCDEKGNVSYWEWAVDPRTRQPIVPPDDLKEILDKIRSFDTWVFHNAKFDIRMLGTIGLWDGMDLDEDVWPRVEDTVLKAHLLASNRPKNLTDLAMRYLEFDIEPLEKRLAKLVQEARRVAKKEFPDWALAEEGRADMPSCKGSVYKFDYWLPAAMVRAGHTDRTDWESCLRDYANPDPEVTIVLDRRFDKLIAERKLGKIYQYRRTLMPIGYRLEDDGVTASAQRFEVLKEEYTAESENAGAVCENIAAEYTWIPPTDMQPTLLDSVTEFSAGLTPLQRVPYQLELPKNGVNNSLRTFMFEVMGLEERFNPKASTDAPTLNKDAMKYYLETLPPNSKQLRFIQSLLDKRARDTAIQYMNGYEKFWLPTQWADFRRLHPSLNQTGSDTLRWTSSNPNEQNISKREGFNLRQGFGPEPDREWFSLDAKNIELRLPFYKCKQPELIELFERPDDPPFYGSNHILNFSVVYPDLWAEAVREVGLDKAGPHVKKKYASTWYQWCKNGGFAIQYQAGERTADAAFHRQGCWRLLKERFNKLTQLNETCVRFANRHGYIETMPDKTVDPERGYPLLCTRTDQGRILETVPLSYYIQGSAMWWTGKAMIRTSDCLAQWNHQCLRAAKMLHADRERKKQYLLRKGYRIVLQVHDEIVFDFPKRADPTEDPANSNLSLVMELKRLMELGGDDFDIPTPVGVEYHSDNWSEGVTL